jgi:hypothetical protein
MSSDYALQVDGGELVGWEAAAVQQEAPEGAHCCRSLYHRWDLSDARAPARVESWRDHWADVELLPTPQLLRRLGELLLLPTLWMWKREQRAAARM